MLAADHNKRTAMADKPEIAARGKLEDKDYNLFAEYLETLCGIVLGKNKQYLVLSRLAPMLEEYHVESYAELIELLIKEKRKELAAKVVDAMTTNETSWFRDQFPFEQLKHHILPEFLESGRRRVNVWSAACSSGQEPYSISMAIAEFLDSHSKCFMNPKVTATDISPEILAQARKGVYDEVAVSRGLSATQRKRFFTPLNDHFQVTAEVRSRVSFQLLDLQKDYSILGNQDLIFCRNVLIYFSSDLRDKIIERMVNLLNPKGYLYLGASESLGRFARHFSIVRGDGGVVHQLK